MLLLLLLDEVHQQARAGHKSGIRVENVNRIGNKLEQEDRSQHTGMPPNYSKEHHNHDTQILRAPHAS